MKTTNIKIIFATILVFALLSGIAHAKPLTDAFLGGLIQINDFFENEEYVAYSKTIDFFFFALIFIIIYMIGVRYSFKEVHRPERIMAISLGSMTAFLLVAAGFSVTIFLPFIHWVFYFLIFWFWWWLLG
ncbi:MAG: hypothetical protein AABX33_05185 [Nanoarchaeota archaeon]